MSLSVFNEIVEKICNKIGISKDKISNIRYSAERGHYTNYLYYTVYIHLKEKLYVSYHYHTILCTEYDGVLDSIHIIDESCVEIIIHLTGYFDDYESAY